MGGSELTRESAGSGAPGWRPRTLEELTPEERAEYDRELDSGVTELPPNQPKGLLGEKGPDLRKPEDFTPNMNAGFSQEDDGPVQTLLLLLVYLLFFPLAFVLLWRARRYSTRYKILVSAAMTIGVLVVAILVMRG